MSKPKSKPKRTDFEEERAKVHAAMLRAAERARQRAIDTNTYHIAYPNEPLVSERPKSE